MKEKLEELLNLPLDGKLLIFTHDNPDPDSIASAAAMAHLLREKRGTDATLAYSGIVGRAENRAMVEQLDFRIQHLVLANFDFVGTRVVVQECLTRTT
ncbi:MAG: hypothetical protein KY432_01685 [Acidobacteria bacterium]|nr:hypothetical protein [Acidobacteriota bacterium]